MPYLGSGVRDQPPKPTQTRPNDPTLKSKKSCLDNGVHPIHSSHIRDESDYNIGLFAALDEVIDIGRGSGVKTEISHLKCLGPRMWGKSAEVLAKVEAARTEGLDVLADQYPTWPQAPASPEP